MLGVCPGHPIPFANPRFPNWTWSDLYNEIVHRYNIRPCGSVKLIGSFSTYEYRFQLPGSPNPGAADVRVRRHEPALCALIVAVPRVIEAARAVAVVRREAVLVDIARGLRVPVRIIAPWRQKMAIYIFIVCISLLHSKCLKRRRIPLRASSAPERAK
jgi:hypothetical protein